TQTPFSTTASEAQPTEQCEHTVRLTSTLPAPMATGRPSAARALRIKASWPAASPTPTPRPERCRNARLSIVGKALERPRRRLWMKGEAAVGREDDGAPSRAAPVAFLVNSMVQLPSLRPTRSC